MSDLPEYVVRGGAQTFAPPILAKGTRMSTFALRADSDALVALVNKYLNGPGAAQTDLQFYPVGDYVFLAYAPMDHISVTDPVDSQKGWMKETDVAFWMLVVGGTEGANGFEPKMLAWFMPYVWVDVPTAMTTGREVYGFPKELAWLTLPKDDSDPLVFGLEAMVLPKFSPDTEIVRRPLISVSRQADSEPGLEKAFSGAEAVLAEVVRLLHGSAGKAKVGGMDFWLDLLRDLTHEEVPMIFLKEFRDAAEPHRACYQRLIRSASVVKAFHGAYPLLADYKVTLQNYDSHPFLKDFGFASTELSSALSFYVSFDFLLELGTEVK